jgi:predicted nucleotidyltransferase
LQVDEILRRRDYIRRMRKDEVIAKIKAHADEIRARGATALYLFGSTVRGESRADSDVDVFIERDETQRFSIHDRFRLQDYLSTLLDADVDLGLRSELHPVLREEILQEAIRVL